MKDHMTAAKLSPAGFSGLGIAPGLMAAIARLNFVEPTAVQRKSIPVGLEGKDVIVIAQTGTGKTLAYGIPLIQRLAQIKGRGLVLLPSRELAIQVDEALKSVGKAVGMRSALLIGGASMSLQRTALLKRPRIIIATPGRLLDHMQHRTVDLTDVRILVLDEADRMLDMGFAPQINRVFDVVPKDRQTMLFSATMPGEIVHIAQKRMKLPIHVEIAPPGTTADRVEQEVFFVDRENKTSLLEILLKESPGSTLVFTRTKHGARKLTRSVKNMGHSAAELHSDRTQAQRQASLAGFKSGKYRVLVATDIAARGLDVTGIEMVVNYDLPTETETYVHRIGRTGRAGQPGRAVSFATFDQRSDIRDIERLIRTALPVSKLPSSLPARTRLDRPEDIRSQNVPTRVSPPREQPAFGRAARRDGFKKRRQIR